VHYSGGAASDWWPWQTARLAHDLPVAMADGAVQAMTCRNSTSPVGRMRTSPPKCLSSEGPMDPLLPTRFQGTQSKPCPPRTETRRQRMLWIGAVVSLLRLLPLFSPPRQTTLASRATRKLETRHLENSQTRCSDACAATIQTTPLSKSPTRTSARPPDVTAGRRVESRLAPALPAHCCPKAPWHATCCTPKHRAAPL
jgi:hypothetical protein